MEIPFPFPFTPTRIDKAKINFYNSTNLSLSFLFVYFYKYSKTLLDMLLVRREHNVKLLVFNLFVNKEPFNDKNGRLKICIVK